MPHERRLAAFAAIGLFLTMFLPWYQRQFFVVVGGKLAPGSDSQTAWAQFSFVEAAVLLVAAGVLTLLFQRAEGKAFHLPGGDGWVIMAAGCWTCVLIVWRIFDRQGGSAHGQNATAYGIEWGIFVALGVGAFLAYAGSRIRASHRPEPPLPGEGRAPLPGEGRAPLPGEGRAPLPGEGRAPLPGEGRAPLAGEGGGPEEPLPPAGPLPSADPRPSTGPGNVDSTAPTIRRTRPASVIAPGDEEPRRERGWLTAPRRDRSAAAPEPQTPKCRSVGEPPLGSSGEPPPQSSGEPPPLWSNLPRPPRPVAADREAPGNENETQPIAPQTPAAERRRRPPSEDLTIPLEPRDRPEG